MNNVERLTWLWFYWTLLVLLVLWFYVVPEVVQVVRGDVAPSGLLTDEPFAAGTVGGVAVEAWNRRSEFANPLDNSLIRFFLVTAIVGVVWDQLKKLRSRP